MTWNFVRYSPEIESIDPDIEERLDQIIGFWEKKGRESPTTEGSGMATRGAHAKALGVMRASVEFLDGLAEPYAQGIFATPGRHDALIRFSSASNHLGPDAQLGPVLGFAMKMFGIEGPSLVDDEPDAGTFDLVLKNSPFFVANTAKHYLFIEELGNDLPKYLTRGQQGFHEFLNDFVTGKGTLRPEEWAWKELFAFVKTATQTPVRNPLLTPYWSMAAIRYGDYIAKVRVAPAAGSANQVLHTNLDIKSGPDVFGPALEDEMKAHPYDFDLQVQLCTDLKAMPVNDSTVEWPEKLSPFVTVGHVHLPRQDISRPATVEKGDALAFNQWRVTALHRPLGEIMDVRRIYTASAKVRRLINGQAQQEPVTAEDVVPNAALVG